MKVAVVGIGTAGSAAALLLARDGHDVEIFERVAAPSGVGAGILLQGLGQRVLDELGLADALESRSTPVRRIDARTKAGRRVLDFGYDDLVPGSYGWGVHRGTLFDLLYGAVQDRRDPDHDRPAGRWPEAISRRVATRRRHAGSWARSISSSARMVRDPASGA